MDTKFPGKIKSALKEAKISLEKELESFAKSDASLAGNWQTKHDNNPDDNQLETAADEMQDYDNKVSVEHSLELRLRDVNIALKKIEAGEYGLCEKCAKKIEQERLLACPEARVCLACRET